MQVVARGLDVLGKQLVFPIDVMTLDGSESGKIVLAVLSIASFYIKLFTRVN